MTTPPLGQSTRLSFATESERLAFENGQMRQAGHMMLGLLDTIWTAAKEGRVVDPDGLRNRIEFYERYFDPEPMSDDEYDRIDGHA